MATKKDIKALLKRLNLTENDMDKYWNELIETNWKVKSLNKSGKTWRDLHISVIAEMPTQKERDLAYTEEQRIKKEKEEEEKLRKQAEEDYYMDHFEEIMVNKIDNGESLSEDELKELVYEYEIDTIEGDSGRWTQSMETIVELQGRTFAIYWQRGLTECQENEFYDQPYEVEKKTYEKTITVTEWVRK